MCPFLSVNNIPVLPASLSHNIGFRYRPHAQVVTVQWGLSEEQTKKERIQDKFLEPDEAAALLDHMKSSGKLQWYHLTRILLSGLRIGEAGAREQADISDEYITINKTYDHIKLKKIL